MYSFDYQRPEQSDAAVQFLKQHEDAKYLGGGQSLLPTMRLRLARPSALVDVTRIAAMKSIAVTGDKVTIGGAVCHAEVGANADVKRALPGLAQLASHIGDRQVRERGTIGGSLANDDPAACYPAAVLALNATVVTDRRRIAADDFFLGMYETALEPRLYVDSALVTDGLLEPSDTKTYCPYKGTASYWSARIRGELIADVAWSYQDPLPEAASLAGLLSFDDTRVTVQHDLPSEV